MPSRRARWIAGSRKCEPDWAIGSFPSTNRSAKLGRAWRAGPLPFIDSRLAATAKVHDLTLVTRNTADVVRTGVSLLDPFAA